MLVLSRKLHEKIVLPTLKVAVQVVGIKGGAVRLGIQAPREVTVLREEIPDRAAEWAEQASRPAAPPAPEPQAIKFWQPLYQRLKSAGVRLGLLRLQLDTGLTEEAANSLAEKLRNRRAVRNIIPGMAEVTGTPHPTAPVATAPIFPPPAAPAVPPPPDPSHWVPAPSADCRSPARSHLPCACSSRRC